MSEKIDIETFNHLVELAALELEAEQAAYLHREINKQMVSIHELAGIPMDETIKPASHGVPYTNENSPEFRQDVWKPFPDPAEILKQAPQLDGEYLLVPDTPHTTLK